MREPLATALQQALDQVTPLPQTEAVLFFGTAATGQPDLHSDLDLYVILREEATWRQTTVRRYAGVEAEVHFAPARWWRRRMEERAPVILSAFATGRIIHGQADDLLVLARRLWERGPESLKKAEVARARYYLTDLAGDLADVAGGPASQVRYLGTLLLDQALEAYCRLNRLWGDKPKRRVGYVEQHDPELGRLARAFLERGEPELIQAVVDRVLAPFGGRLLTYEGKRQPVE